ncbi:MAG TPA: acyl-CoA dehydrogenase family protein, partial [Methylomirabilota bacterium]|nr:acyl-CoA dehydrogenase family protein [Methylomirabilota bacterium]
MAALTAHSRYFTEEHEIFREQVRNFVNKEVLPHIDRWEEEELFPKSLYRRMGELGFLGIRYPEKYGGSNGDIW